MKFKKILPFTMVITLTLPISAISSDKFEGLGPAITSANAACWTDTQATAVADKAAEAQSDLVQSDETAVTAARTAYLNCLERSKDANTLCFTSIGTELASLKTARTNAESQEKTDETKEDSLWTAYNTAVSNQETACK